MDVTDEDINVAKLATVLEYVETLPEDIDIENNEKVQQYIHEVLLADNEEIRNNLSSSNSD
jgi:anti-anti-sigma regulatory factor